MNFPGAAGVVKFVCAVPEAPVVVLATLNDPPDAAHVTVTFGTGLPNPSIARTLSETVDVFCTVLVSADARSSAEAPCPIATARSVAEPSPDVAAAVFKPTVSPIVHSTDAMPSESVTADVDDSSPWPVCTANVTDMLPAGAPSWTTFTRNGMV